MTPDTASATGHTRHVNGHVPTNVHAFIQQLSLEADPETGEYTIDLEPDSYRDFRNSGGSRHLFFIPFGSTVLIRETVGHKMTGRWFTGKLSDTGWATVAEARIPDAH